MIAFDLACECGYCFEGWFVDYDDYTRQKESGLICCPACEKFNTVRKVLSPVSVHTRDTENRSHDLGFQKKSEWTKGVETAARVLQELQEYVEENFKDVGTDFTQKTLKIHYGVEEPSNIRGVVSDEEEKVLNNEGIHLLKIPMLKKKIKGSN